MKKIISIICVIAMMLSMAVVVNAADANEITIELVSQNETTAVYAVKFNTTLGYRITSVSAFIDATDAIAKGAKVTPEAVTATSVKTQTKKGVTAIVVGYAPSDGSTFTGDQTLATLTFDMTAVTEAFALTKATSGSTVVQAYVEEGSAPVAITSEFTFAPNVTVAPYVAPKTEETAPVNPANENAEFKFDGQTWTNVAIYEASFVLADIDTTKDYGIKEGNNKFSASIAGEGTTTFVLAYYGVTTAPTVEKFWTGK